MVFKNGEIKTKKPPRGRPGACDEDRRQAGDIRQRKVQGSNPVAAKQDGRTPGPARPSSGSCQHSETPVGAKFVKALCASEIAKPSSGSRKQGAMPSSSACSRVSADPNSRPRRRPDAEEGSESSGKQVCPYSYCSLNGRDPARQLSFKRFMDSRRGSAPLGAAGINSGARRDLGTENTRKKRCPYAYCSLNDGDRAKLLSFKRSRASRRGLMKKGFDAAVDDSEAAGNRSRGQGLNPPMADCDVTEDNTLMPVNCPCNGCLDGSGDSVNLSAESGEDRRPGCAACACKSTECDRGGLEFDVKPPLEGIRISESLFDGSGSQPGADDFVKQLEEYKGGTVSPSVDVSACDVAEINCESYPQSEASDPHCFVEMDALGILCGGHAEPDRSVDESLLESTAGIEGEVKGESGSDAGNLTDESVSEIGASDCLEQSLGCKDDADSGQGNDACDYGCTMDDEPLCLVQIDGLGILCGGHTEADRPVDELLLESTAGIKGEVKKESGSDAGNLTDRPVSEIGADDCLEQSIRCKDDADSGQGNDVCDYGCTMDDEPLCLVQMDGLGILCGVHTEADRPVDELLLESTAGIEGEVKEESGTDAGNLMDKPVSEIGANDCLEQSLGCKDDADSGQGNDVRDYGCTMDDEPLCLVQIDGLGILCGGHTEADRPVDELLLESTVDINGEVKEESGSDAGNLTDGPVSEIDADDGLERSIGCKDDADSGEGDDVCDYGCKMDDEPLCLVQMDGLGILCGGHTEADRPVDELLLESTAGIEGEVKEESGTDARNLMDEPVSEIGANDCLEQSIGCKDDADSGEGNDVCDYGCTMDDEPLCLVQMDGLGILCGGHIEADRPVDESLLELTAGIKAEVMKEESGTDAGNLMDEPVSDISTNDCLAQFVGCEDDADSRQVNDVSDYDCSMDNEPLCLVQADNLEVQCSMLTNSDDLQGGSVNDNGASCKHEVKDEAIKIAESLLNGSDSEFCIDDSRQFAECDEGGQDVNNRSDSGVSVHETIEWNDYDYGDEGEHVKIAEDLLNGYNSECAVDDFRPFAEGNEDGDGHDCSLASDVSPHEPTDAGDYDYGHGMDGVPCCFVQLEAAGIQGSSHEEPSRPLDGSRFNLCASPLTEVKEENINIAVPVSSVDRPPFELSASPNGKKNGKAEEYTNVEEAIVDHLVSEICANGSIKQLTEHDDGQNGHFRTGTDVFVPENKEFNDYDCDHHMDAKPWHSVQVDDFEMHCSNQTEPDSPLDGWPLEFRVSCESEVEEDYYKITAESSMNGPVAESSPCSGNHIKQCRHIAEENGNEDQQVKFRRRRYGHRFSEPISEVEKVNLRHQLIPERKAAEEWMIDYALIKMVNELSPLRKKKVEMLVEAFESVLPLSKCETNDLEHGRTNFSHIWPMQACN